MRVIKGKKRRKQSTWPSRGLACGPAAPRAPTILGEEEPPPLPLPTLPLSPYPVPCLDHRRAAVAAVCHVHGGKLPPRHAAPPWRVAHTRVASLLGAWPCPDAVPCPSATPSTARSPYPGAAASPERSPCPGVAPCPGARPRPGAPPAPARLIVSGPAARDQLP
jgi:hypothetical protein